MRQWFQRLFSGRASAPPQPARRRGFRPTLEVLEDRLALSTYSVISTADAGFGTLRYYAGKAQTGDTINFSPQVAGQTITLSSPVKLGVDGFGNPNGVTNVTIDGQSVHVTISGNNATRLFEVVAGSDSINNLALTNGQVTGSGGAILVDSGASLSVGNDTFTNNTAAGVNGSGGAIENQGTLTVANCRFISNGSNIYGGAIDTGLGASGPLSVSASTFNGNTATSGGAINTASTATFTNNTFQSNQANGSGGTGGAINAEASITLSGNSFTNNSANRTGGAINAIGPATSSNDTFNGNTAQQGGGGAIYAVDTTSLTGDSFQSNSASGLGGAVDAVGITPGTTRLTVSGSTFNGNNTSVGASSGGAIASSDITVVSSSTFTSNGNSGAFGIFGGAIYYDITNQSDPARPYDSSLQVNQDTFTGNGASEGGAIYSDVGVNAGSITVAVTNSTFYQNRAAGFGNNGQGGGVFISHNTSGTGTASAVFINDTFFQNSAADVGGALLLLLINSGTGSNTATLTSNTVYQNQAVNGGGGLSINAAGVGVVTVDNNIFDGNLVTLQGFNGPLDVATSAGHRELTDNGYNLVGTTDTQFSVQKKDILDNNPGLANALAPNGAKPGYPQTLALANTSPGYEQGDQRLAGQPNPDGIDARGLTRQPGKVSIGAEDPDAL
jgi:predicted outer membrane repeat protein